jgi:high affinity choline transporter 7
MAVSFAVRIGAGEPLLGLPMLLPLPVDAAGAPTVPIKTIAMIAGLGTMWAVSRMTAERCAPVPLVTTDFGLQTADYGLRTAD